MSKRTSVLVATAVLAASALIGGGAEAAAKCKKFKPTTPTSVSSDPSGALEAKVVKLTDKATEKSPLVVEYEHGPAIADYSIGAMYVEDPKYFNFQVVTKEDFKLLNVQLVWAAPSPSDIDLYLFGDSGAEIDSSVSYNPLSDAPFNSLFPSDDANGLEQIRDIGVRNCAGVTVESRPATTPGEKMKLVVWLG